MSCVPMHPCRMPWRCYGQGGDGRIYKPPVGPCMLEYKEQGLKERKMLAGHTGELLLGVMSIVIAVVVVWLLVYAAARGSARREEDRRRQQRNQEP
jgi:hypothetical protein